MADSAAGNFHCKQVPWLKEYKGAFKAQENVRLNWQNFVRKVRR